ncbi:MAG: 2'-deoxycytidine 5'-triphosphate deaminase [Neomegalonema sp.]|nr:2'-deoxycytidine 5'-triphosphate deaminase [Neomegalonema sp.]
MGGVLPSQMIRNLLSQGAISAADDADPVRDDQVQPASLDLRLGRKAYRVRASFLTGSESTVADRLAQLSMHEIDLTGGGAVLETGCVYVAPLQETLDLPRALSAVANAKSSTGRLDVFTRLITDRGSSFDRIEPGYQGPLYAEISPRTFSVLARTGDRLNQIRLRQGDARFSSGQLAQLQADEALVRTASDGAERAQNDLQHGLAFSVDLRPEPGQPAGWRARRHSGLIDLRKIDHYRPAEFWEPVHAEGGRLILDPGAFYILVSRESVHVPPHCAAEMTAYLPMVGEFRVHYAGFFDPGFGHDAAGGAGARGVLEVRCHEAPFVLDHGQVVGRLVYEPMIERPDTLYGTDIGSNYQAQGLRLSKHFSLI